MHRTRRNHSFYKAHFNGKINDRSTYGGGWGFFVGTAKQLDVHLNNKKDRIKNKNILHIFFNIYILGLAGGAARVKECLHWTGAF